MIIRIQKKDIMWSYLGALLSMTANIIMIPFLVYFLSSDMLGLWYVFCSIGAMTALFDFGFSTTFARNITYCWSGASILKKEGVDISSENNVDWSLLSNVLVTCKKVYLYISTLVLVLLLTLGSYYIFKITHGIVNISIWIAWTIYVVAVFFNIYYGYYVAFLRGIGEIATVNKNTVYARIIQISTTILILYFGAGLIGACLAYLLYGFIIRFMCKKSFYEFQNLAQNISAEYISKKQCKIVFDSVWNNAWRDGLVSISNYMSDQASIIICSLFFSLRETGEYSLMLQMATAIGIVSTIPYSAFQPVIQSAYVRRDDKKIIETMSLIVTAYLMMFSLLFFITYIIGFPFMRLIKPEVELPFMLFSLASLYQFILKLRNCYTSYFSCTNRIPYVKSFFCTSMFTIILSVIVIDIFKMNIYWILYVQILTQLIFNAWYWIIKAHQEFNISFFDMLILGFSNLKLKVGGMLHYEKKCKR